MRKEEHIFDDSPLSEERIADMKASADELLNNLEAKPDLSDA